MALVACSKEQDAPVVETPKTKTVRIQLSAGRDEESARALFGIKDDGSGATTGLEMPEKDVLLRIAVKQGTGTPVYQTIQFKKTPGRNHATYTGDITVPVGGSGDYKIAAAHLSDVGGKEYIKMPAGVPERYLAVDPYMQLTKVNADGKLDINVPYATHWQEITVVGNNANSVSLQLKPVGSLLRMRIHNKTNTDQTFYNIRLTSSAIGLNGTVLDFENEYENAPALRTNNLASVSYRLNGTAGIQVGAGAYSDWYYLVLFGRSDIRLADAYSLFEVQNASLQAKYTKSTRTGAMIAKGSSAITLPFEIGHEADWEGLPESTYEFGQEVGTPKNVLEYFAESYINASGTGFATSLAEVGYYDQATAIAKFGNPVEIDGQRYSLPTKEEAASLYPLWLDKDGVAGSTATAAGVGVEALNVYESNIKIGDHTQDYRADYKRDANTMDVFYSIRFKNSTNYNRTAFRYRSLIENGVNYVAIEAIHLGNSAEGIQQIANTAYWTANASKIVTRKFIRNGYYGYANTMTAPQGTNFWTSSKLDRTTGLLVSPMSGVISPIGDISRISVYPYKR